MGLSRLSKTCKECQYKDTCNNKRMEAFACLPEINMAPLTTPNAMPLTISMMQHHNYHDIKISESTIVTIDFEDIKKKLKESCMPRLFEHGA